MNRNSSERTIGEVLGVLKKYQITADSDAHSIRLALEELGPTFVKLGQLLATQSDIFPAELCDELRELRDEVAPMTAEEVDSVIFDAYGKHKDEVFAYFEEEAHGSASLSQVHRAKLFTGEDVAVKIQRIGARQSMEKDIEFIRRLVRKIPFIRKNQFVDINDVIKELSEITHYELDFNHEAKNLQRFRELNEDVPYVSCPGVYPELTTDTVLVMDYINGFQLSDKKALDENGYDINEIGKKYVRSFFKQAFEDGFFQADPHTGNLKISGGKIVWYDLGMMGEFSERNRNSFLDVIEAFVTGDVAKGYDAYTGMCRFPEKIDKEALFRDVSDLVSSISKSGVEDLDIVMEMKKFMKLAKRHHARLDPTYTMLTRGMATVQGTINELFPEIDFLTEVKRLAIEFRISEARNRKKDRELEFLRRHAKRKKIGAIPENIAKMVEQYSKGLAPVNIEMGVPEKSQPFIMEIVRLMVDGFIIVALLISSSIIVLSGLKPLIWGMPLLGVIGYSIAVIMIFIHIIKRFLKRS